MLQSFDSYISNVTPTKQDFTWTKTEQKLWNSKAKKEVYILSPKNLFNWLVDSENRAPSLLYSDTYLGADLQQNLKNKFD